MAIAVLTGVALLHHLTNLLIPNEVTLTPGMQTTNSPELPTAPDQLLRWQTHGRPI